MKKIVLLLAALFILSSFVYADVGIGIWGRTVFVVAAGRNYAEGEESWIYQGWGPDWGGGPSMGFEVWWTSDVSEYHFKWAFDRDNFSGSKIAQAWGKIKIVPDLMTLQVGLRDSQDDFRETTPVSGHDYNAEDVGRLNGWGVVIMVEPKDTGFKLGLQWRTPIGTEGWVDYPKVLDANDNPFQGNLYNAGVCASYTMPEMVKITVGTVINGQDWQGDAGILWPNQNRSIFGRIHLLMVPDLTLWLLVKYQGLEPYENEYDTNADGEPEIYIKPNSSMDVVLGAKYAAGDFSIGFGGYLNMAMPKDDDNDATDEINTTNIGVTLDPNYKLTDLNIGAVIGMEMKMDDDDVDDEYGQYIFVEPYVGIPKFNMRIGFTYGMNANLNTAELPDGYAEDFTWSLYVQTDFSFW